MECTEFLLIPESSYARHWSIRSQNCQCSQDCCFLACLCRKTASNGSLESWCVSRSWEGQMNLEIAKNSSPWSNLDLPMGRWSQIQRNIWRIVCWQGVTWWKRTELEGWMRKHAIAHQNPTLYQNLGKLSTFGFDPECQLFHFLRRKIEMRLNLHFPFLLIKITRIPNFSCSFVFFWFVPLTLKLKLWSCSPHLSHCAMKLEYCALYLSHCALNLSHSQNKTSNNKIEINWQIYIYFKFWFLTWNFLKFKPKLQLLEQKKLEQEKKDREKKKKIKWTWHCRKSNNKQSKFEWFQEHIQSTFQE